VTRKPSPYSSWAWISNETVADADADATRRADAAGCVREGFLANVATRAGVGRERRRADAVEVMLWGGFAIWLLLVTRIITTETTS